MSKKAPIIVMLVVLLIGSIAIVAKAVSKTPAQAQSQDHSPALEKIVFIHYHKGFTKAIGRPLKTSKCYGFLAQGVKIKSPKALTINSDLDASTIWLAASEWDSHTSKTLFSNYISDPTANWDNTTPDGRNEFSFGNYPEPGVIAVTVVWGYFSGSPQTREIKEFDVLFNNNFDPWGDAAVDPSVMDLRNIATHEIGHGLGLDDVYNSVCNQVTMYGYSDYGETIKRTLEQPDITGLQKLYGI